MSTPEALPCPACGSDCNERDELTTAEREIERLTAAPAPHPDTADAERYRWLRQMSDTMAVSISINGNGAEISETLDAAIDAARAQAQKGE